LNLIHDEKRMGLPSLENRIKRDKAAATKIRKEKKADQQKRKEQSERDKAAAKAK